MQQGNVHIDTMHLVVKYPHRDVFDEWYHYVKESDGQNLKNGIPARGFIIRGGGSSYKISLWQHDVRVYLTDRVDDVVGEYGTGIWIQLGPKFLIEHADDLQGTVSDLLAAVGVFGEFPIRITRLDLAIDLFGASIENDEARTWTKGWVGRSNVSSVFFSEETGNLGTIYVGKKKSPITLRIYDKVAEASKNGTLTYWQDIWHGYPGPVTRVEWDMHLVDAKFEHNLNDFSSLNKEKIKSLLIYLLKWGRLCIPDPESKNRTRWKDAAFWANVRQLAESFSKDTPWPTSRLGKTFRTEISDGYIRSVTGVLTGAMARFADAEPVLQDVVDGLEKRGMTKKMINQKAADKANILRTI